MIALSGRPRRNWDCQVSEMAGSLVIRLDDRDDPEFWCEVVIDGPNLVPAACACLRTSMGRMHNVPLEAVTLPAEWVSVMRLQLGDLPPSQGSGEGEIGPPAQR